MTPTWCREALAAQARPAPEIDIANQLRFILSGRALGAGQDRKVVYQSPLAYLLGLAGVSLLHVPDESWIRLLLD
jgi:hypothetical protein